MTPKEALAALCLSPETFLRSYPLMIAGKSVSGPTDYVIFQELPTDKKFKIAAFGNNGEPLKAYNVPMLPSTQFQGLGASGPNRVQIPGVMLGNDRDVMVTGQLTGCSFLVQSTGGSVLCAHIQPQGGLDGSKLHTSLINSAQFQGQPATTRPIVFGRNFYPAGRATVVGVRRLGRWEIYAQLGDAHSVTGVHRIL